MKWRILVALGALCVWMLPAGAAAKEAPGQAVDSGSFGVFVNGQRVATETFSVQKTGEGSTINSRVRAEGGSDPGQKSELKISTAGEMLHYEWHDLGSAKAELTVSPKDQFLVEHVSTGPSDKPMEQPFLMPSSTMVLDNNSFVQRELLAWRYLGSACKQEDGKTQCPTAATQFGVLVPQERSSMSVSLQVVGREKVKIKGADRELLKVVLKQESGDWALYLDDQDNFKLIRILVAGNNTEILRD